MEFKTSLCAAFSIDCERNLIPWIVRFCMAYLSTVAELDVFENCFTNELQTTPWCIVGSYQYSTTERLILQ